MTQPNKVCFSRFSHVVALALLCACGDYAGDSLPTPAHARSDGSVGGDIMALEVWYSESLCACTSGPESCITRIWDEDAIGCVRDGYNRLARQDADAAECVRTRLRDGVDCMQSASCPGERDDCNVAAYRAVVKECPLPDGDAATQLWSCFADER